MKNAKRRKRIFLSETEITNNESETAHTPHRWRRFFFAAAIALLVSFTLYGNILNGGFVYDDSFFFFRQDIRRIESLLHIWSQPYDPQDGVMGNGFYRPLWVASLAVNFILFGENPFSFHFVNTLLYAAVLLLLYFVSRRLFKDELIAIFTSLFFAFLPIHTEAVANIKSRDELLSAMFILGSWYAFLRAGEHKDRLWSPVHWVSAALLFLSLLSKENGVLMPGLFFVVWYMEKRPSVVKMTAAALPFVAAYIAYFLLRFHALGPYTFFEYKSYYVLNPLTGVPVLTRISTAFEILYLYIVKTIFPYHLSASYEFATLPIPSHPFSSWMSVLGLGLTLVLLTVSIVRVPRTIRVGALFFIASYITMSKFLFAKGALFGERLIFLPSVGLSIVAAWFFTRLTRRYRAIGVSVFAVCLIAYATITTSRNLVWREELGFYEQMVKDAPSSVQARSTLAVQYFVRSRLKESLTQAKAAYAIYPNHPPALNVMGKIAYLDKDYMKAALLFRRALELEPESADNRNFLALTLIKLGNYDESFKTVQKQYEAHPENGDWRFIIAIGLYKSGRIEEALSEKYRWAPSLTRDAREQVLRDFLSE